MKNLLFGALVLLMGTFAFGNANLIFEIEKSLKTENSVNIDTYVKSIEYKISEEGEYSKVITFVKGDFTFVFITSCGEVYYEDGYFDTKYYLSDLALAWEIYDEIACG